MSSIIKVDQIQNTSGTAGMTIDSNGDVTFNGANTVTPVDSGWITATLNSGFSNYGDPYGPIRYRKIGNIVNIQGITQESTIAVVFTLPEGFRPPIDVVIAAQNNNSLARVDIQKDGDVYILDAPTSSWVSLACTFFTA